MQFSSKKNNVEPPEINLIPFIDVLLVIIIFLMLSTTYSKFTELDIKLPTADTEQQKNYPQEIIVSINSNGQYSIDKQPVKSMGVQELAHQLKELATEKNQIVIIRADALTSHQSVISVMEAAQIAGISQITFAAQKTP